ncbi:ATP-binding cassette domain-containing protein [Bacillus mangrovi]|uniref:ATP-binding cassette domain-containing protein n=1 Tax=Metabacillus mangrovi TaxID=1491830 RepID=A0A7X2V5N5_9BACI|nr:ABC transporter ATP-binding protein [Metabacillus mangrovi]MTH54645.1 ATP-binding cassette domain-containing protein [Metabacillus mangrovi]
MEHTIEIVHVSKSFGKHRVLHDVSLSLKKGEIFGLLGPNGSGKTTLLSLLTGSIRSEAGDMRILNEAVSGTSILYKLNVGIVPDSDELVDDLTAMEFLEFTASLRKIPKFHYMYRIKEWLQLFDIWKSRNQLLKSYSHGMRKKVQLISALLHRPKIFIFDEPTNGLDPDMIILVKEILAQLKEKGTTILVTTHHLGFAETLCDRIAFINKGSILVQETEVVPFLKASQSRTLEEAYTKMNHLGAERMRVHGLMEDW